MWRSLIASIQFLTVIPVGASRAFEAHRTLPYFPICGLLIGSLLVTVDHLAAMLWPLHVAAVVDTVFLVFITGALHLDGLADTADGLYGCRPPQRALEIMKDSRIGAIGMIAVVCGLGIKWAGLSAVEVYRPLWLLVVPAVSRSTVMFAVRFLPYGRPQGGTGHAFFEKRLRLADYWSMALLGVIVISVSAMGLVWIACGGALVTAMMLIYYRIKINCITGDMLGALIEIVEAGLFLLLAASGPFL